MKNHPSIYNANAAKIAKEFVDAIDRNAAEIAKRIMDELTQKGVVIALERGGKAPESAER